MAEASDKPTTLPRFVADALRALHRARPVVEKFAAAAQRIPEDVKILLDFVQQLKREEPNSPSTTANETPATANPATLPAALETPRRRAQRDEQRPRILRALHKVCPPFGLPPRDWSYKTARDRVILALDEEKAAGLAPKDEEHVPDPSVDAVTDAIKELRNAAAIEGACTKNPLIRGRH